MKVVVAGLVFVHGCAGPDCVTPEPTIAQGIYGFVTYRSDVGHASPHPSPGKRVAVLDGELVIAETRSDVEGLYQLALEPGAFVAENDTRYDRSDPFTIAAGDLIRVDVYTEFGPTGFLVVDPDACRLR
jgi:hypothetical protein